MTRKTALAIALAFAFPAVHAQTAPSTVQLYGIVDVGVERVDNGAVSVTRLTSGISTGSRWGLRGSEDLGGGYRALFTLESRFEIDTGTVNNRGATFFCGAPAACPGVVLTGAATALPPATQAVVLANINAILAGPTPDGLLQAVSTVNGANALFDRQAFAGLVTPYGAILAGRQYTPNYEVLVKFNSFADSFAGNPGQIATINIRANNALQYRAELKGFTLSAMYGFGGTEGSRSESSAAPTRGDDFYGVNLQYSTPSYGVGLGYNRNNTVTFSAPTENRKGLETYSIGGMAAMGSVKLFAQYLKSKNENPVLTPDNIQSAVLGGAGAVNAMIAFALPRYNRFDVDALRGLPGPTDLDVYHLGLQWTVGRGTLMAAYNRSKDTPAPVGDPRRSPWVNGDAKVDQIGLAYMYNLSQRSQLYGAYAVANNKDDARIALGAACCTGGWTTARGEDSKSIQIGMRHTF